MILMIVAKTLPMMCLNDFRAEDGSFPDLNDGGICTCRFGQIGRNPWCAILRTRPFDQVRRCHASISILSRRRRCDRHRKLNRY